MISKEKGLHYQTPEFPCVLSEGTTFPKHFPQRYKGFFPPKTGTTSSDACIWYAAYLPLQQGLWGFIERLWHAMARWGASKCFIEKADLTWDFLRGIIGIMSKSFKTHMMHSRISLNGIPRMTNFCGVSGVFTTWPITHPDAPSLGFPSSCQWGEMPWHMPWPVRSGSCLVGSMGSMGPMT